MTPVTIYATDRPRTYLADSRSRPGGVHVLRNVGAYGFEICDCERFMQTCQCAHVDEVREFASTAYLREEQPLD